MIYLALIAWMGWKLYAPIWFWVCWYILVFGKVVTFIFKIFEWYYKNK